MYCVNDSFVSYCFFYLKIDVKVNSDLKHGKEALRAEEKKKKEMNKNITDVNF